MSFEEKKKTLLDRVRRALSLCAILTIYTVDDGSFSSGMHMQMHMPEQHEKQKLPKSRPSEEFSIKLYPCGFDKAFFQ